MYFSAYQRERNQAEKIEMRGPRRAPAPEQHIKANDQVNQPDDPQAQRQALVERHRNHLHRRIQRNAVAGNAVFNQAIAADAIE